MGVAFVLQILNRSEYMKIIALTLAAGVALTGAAATAQAHEWGGGYGYGYGPRTHSRVIDREGYREGYRGVGLHRGWTDPAFA